MLEVYENTLPRDNGKIFDLIRKSDLDEPFDWVSSKHFMVGKDKDKIVGLVVYGNIKQGDRVVPRFLHIIISPEYKRTKIAYKMLKDSEKVFLNRGHDQIIAYMENELPNKEMKKTYAEKFGYKQYAKTDNGEFFYKPLKGG